MEDRKKTAGRRKIPMEKIENDKDRHITFSKRRAGIYKKACELAELCHADVVIIIFSPSQSPFSFGSPTVYSVVNRFTGNPYPRGDNGANVPEPPRVPYSEDLDEAKSQVEELRAKQRELRKVLPGNNGERWLERPTQDIAYVQAQIRWYQDLWLSLDSTLRQRQDGASGSADPPA